MAADPDTLSAVKGVLEEHMGIAKPLAEIAAAQKETNDLLNKLVAAADREAAAREATANLARERLADERAAIEAENLRSGRIYSGLLKAGAIMAGIVTLLAGVAKAAYDAAKP